jgi:hypothetical protein
MSKMYPQIHLSGVKKRHLQRLLIKFTSINMLVWIMALAIGPAGMNLHAVQAGPCDSPRNLGIAATLTQSPTWNAIQSEWIHFRVQQGLRYRLQVNGAAGLKLAVHDRCDISAPAIAIRDGQLEFTATRDGDYYLMVKGDVYTTSTTGYQVSLQPAAPYRPSEALAVEVPEGLLRRATEFLEELRGSGLAPEWVSARINPTVRILYRPDLQTPAYYEFSVEKPIEKVWEPAGYIQLAAGEHDYPIVNWDTTGMSTTHELAELAPLDATLTQFYRLNTLSYAAEYEQLTGLGISVLSDNVINLGELPNKIEGLETIPEEPFDLVTESLDSDGNKTYDGPTELPLLTEEPWDSWAELKGGYALEYQPLLKSLAQRASSKWELEKMLAQYGETLVKGNIRTVHGLANQILSEITVTGDGAAPRYLHQEVLTNNSIPTGVILSVLEEPEDQQTLLPILVTLKYTEGTTETVKFAIANHLALSLGQAMFLPLVAGSSALPKTSIQSEMEPAAWGPWHYYQVDSFSDFLNIRYNQITAHTGVNTSNCWSGCGATAWAIVFAWFDRRAAASHYLWSSHWGLYRTNGGLGANAVAPTTQDAGVNNMTWEIRNYINTYCTGSGGGATSVTNMINAYRYVQPRATSYWVMRTRYDPTGLCWFGACNEAREHARNQIVNRRTPAIIAANNHYPVAGKYAWQSEQTCFLWMCSTNYNRWFYVNQGWGGAGNDWVDWDDVFFSGTYDRQ